MDQCKSRAEGQFPCSGEGCGKTFTCKESLNRHLKVCKQANPDLPCKKPKSTHKNREIRTESEENQTKITLKEDQRAFTSRVEELVDLIEKS